MFSRRTRIALLCCVAFGAAALADPFAPLPIVPRAVDEGLVQAAEYQVVGVAIAGQRSRAVVVLTDGGQQRFQLLRPGDRFGRSTVTEITLDAVYLETASGAARIIVSD